MHAFRFLALLDRHLSLHRGLSALLVCFFLLHIGAVTALTKAKAATSLDNILEASNQRFHLKYGKAHTAESNYTEQYFPPSSLPTTALTPNLVADALPPTSKSNTAAAAKTIKSSYKTSAAKKAQKKTVKQATSSKPITSKSEEVSVQESSPYDAGDVSGQGSNGLDSLRSPTLPVPAASPAPTMPAAFSSRNDSILAQYGLGKSFKSKTPQVMDSSDEFKTELFVPQAPEGALTLSLSDAVEVAMQHNLTLLIAAVQSKQTLSQKKEAIANFLPDAVLRFRFSRFQGGVQVFDGEPVEAFITTILPEAQISLPINLGGSQLFNYKRKDKEYLLQKLAEAAISQDTLLEVCQLYTQLLTNYLELGVVRQTEREAQEQLKLSEARFNEGLGILLEVLEARNLLQNAQRKAVDVEQAIQNTNIRLSTKLGMEPNVVIVPTMQSLLDIDIYQDQENLEALLDKAIAMEPRVLQAQAVLDARKLAFREAIATALPTVNLTAYVNLVGKELDNLLTTRYAGLEARSEVLQGLGVKKFQEIKRAKLQVEEAELSLEQQKLAAKESVSSVYNEYIANIKRVDYSKQQLETAENARSQAKGRYEAGIGNYLEVVTSSTGLQTARSNYLKELLNYKASQLVLARQVGELTNKLVALKGGSPNIELSPAAGNQNNAQTKPLPITPVDKTPAVSNGTKQTENPLESIGKPIPLSLETASNG